MLTPTVVAERRGVAAFARSFALTGPLQWKLVGVLMLYIVLSLVTRGATHVVFGSVLGLAFGGAGPGSVAAVLTAIAVAGVSTLVSLAAIAFTAKLYLAARAARDPVAAEPLDRAVADDPFVGHPLDGSSARA